VLAKNQKTSNQKPKTKEQMLEVRSSKLEAGTQKQICLAAEGRSAIQHEVYVWSTHSPEVLRICCQLSTAFSI
jgi:hypothetical protein